MTVAEELELRNNCRFGLTGVRMRHEPTGREFECHGSEWDANTRLLVYATAGHYDPGFEPQPDDLGIICAADIDLGKYHPPEKLRAEDCALLSRWPVVCCRPRRRSAKKANAR